MAFVQNASNVAHAVTSFTDTFSSATTSGNLIFIAIADDSGTSFEISSVTDNYSNAYTNISVTSGTPVLSLYYAKNIAGGASHTITVNTAGFGTNYGIVAQEFSGLDTTAPFDVTAAATGTSAAPASGSTAATTSANEQVVGAVAFAGSAAPSLGTGYSNLGSAVQTNADTGMESKTVTATGAQSAAFTLTGSTTWSCACVTFKQSSSGSGIPPTPAIPVFANGTVYHASSLNALGSNLTNLYNYTLAGFRTYKPITVVRILSTGWSTTSGSPALMQFDTVDIDTNGGFDSFLANSSIYSLAVRTSGIYRLYLQFTMVPPTIDTGFIEAHLCLNGTSIPGNAISGALFTGRAVNTHATVGLTAGNSLYGVVTQNTGSTQTSSLTFGGSYLVMEWISP